MIIDATTGTGITRRPSGHTQLGMPIAFRSLSLLLTFFAEVRSFILTLLVWPMLPAPPRTRADERLTFDPRHAYNMLLLFPHNRLATNLQMCNVRHRPRRRCSASRHDRRDCYSSHARTRCVYMSSHKLSLPVLSQDSSALSARLLMLFCLTSGIC